ncbi:protein phosphatase 1 regulatory subunit 12A-like isoform X5 [Toxorhynchites rutilus septentrionalis]|uniref:protein phosphatase 1 regulatory subunit 12A-like isoform X5 n=1 Tax=Toxorhynchites rutilus septentrionalis TaxID=329112 RepID=UPI0024795EDB|nr:protein phosphatase 1 regulatory subunit 12A-like isoform X5 [Toxorhynchites rutilus septentrionalis]
MSMDNRSSSALFKRAEQLKRWEESETNKHSGVPKSPSLRRIKFSSGCIFLAACVAGDKEEVSRLLETGADIDTANVDGLTALHQACIDDNLDMVEFLVQNGADVNRKDNEGWTPLHATSSCGFLSIARYLIENGADLTAINSDGELALDLACSDAMEDLIQRHIDEQGIDCEDARQAEEKIMLSDAKRWLRSDSTDCDKPHPKTGATAVHVASAKGYIKVLGLLLDGRGDFDKQDVDGWTPLHAAAYWGQKEAVQMLLSANVDIDIQNYSGQQAIDIAQKDIVPLLEEARKNFKRPKRRPASQRITDTIENSIETPTKVIRVEVKPIDNKEKEADSELVSGSEADEEEDEGENEESEISEADQDDDMELEESAEELDEPKESEVDEEEVVHEGEEEESGEEEEAEEEEEESEPEASVSSISSPYSSSSSSSSTSAESSMTDSETEVPEKENLPTEPDVILRRTQSFESDEKFYQKYVELRARIQANSCPILPNTNPANVKTAASNLHVQRSASLKDHRTLRKASSNLVLGSTGSATTNVQTTTPQSVPSPPTSPTSTPVSAAPSAGQIRRSFVPPARDEESETQRKAHAKRVRETRRSTQGVTLDEIKSAEQLVKNKNSTSGNSDPAATTSSAVTATTNTTRSRTIASPSAPINDRVPSVDASGDSSATTEVSPITNTTGSRKTPTSAATAGSPSICDQQVSASFTISPPPSSSMSTTATIKPLRGDGGGGGGGEGGGGGDCTSKNKDGSKISVSYTIATPRLSSSNTMTSHSSSSCEAVPPTAKEIDKEDIPTVTATFSVPSAATTNNNNPNSSNNNFNKKTDTDELTKTKPTIGDYSISSTPASSASVTATIRTPSSVYSAGKRSLFDIDNANSLTLAEKLRQEANKYAESDKENFISSKVSTTGTATTAANSSSGLPTAEAPATIKSDITASNITPAAASEGTVSLRKDTSAPSSPLHHQQQQSTLAERRPSWRMKVDHGAKFKLEDATAAPVSTSATITTNTSNAVTALDSANNRQQQNSDFNSVSSVAQRRHNGDSSNLTAPRPASAPEIGSSADISSSQPQQNDASLHLRRPLKTSEENKENDKENENRSSAQATQAVIQRRRRPKRRSTGVVHVDMEDIDPERQDSPVDGEEKESGTEQAARSRVGSTASELAAANQKDAESKENGGDFIDYKTLYEQAKADNDKLKGTLRKKDEEVLSLKAALDRFTTATTKNNSLSELEKRERRAMERKMSEMEEELKLLQKYKTENERLRAENRALTRVVSKLTTSAQNQLHSKQ